MSMNPLRRSLLASWIVLGLPSPAVAGPAAPGVPLFAPVPVAATYGAPPIPYDPPAHLSAPHGPRAWVVTGGERANPDFDMHHIALELTIDPEQQSLDGTATLTVDCVASTGSLDLDLAGLPCTDVRVDGDQASYTQDDWQVHVAGSWVAGERYEVALDYGGVPGTTGWGGLLFVGDVAYTVTEPNGSRYWFPCFDDPSEKSTLTIAVTAPADLTVASNGLLVEETAVDAEHKRTVWQHDHPIAPYLVSLALADYAVLEDEWQGMPLQYFVYPELEQDAAVDMSVHPDLLTLYSTRYGPYPFQDEKYGVALAPMGGAMEHQTCTTACDGCVDGSYGYTLLYAHELAHQWWGDHVTCATWDDIWLNEGFATFSEAVVVEEFQGWEGYLFYIDQMTQTYFSWLEYEGLFPLSEPDYMWGGTVYQKGGVVLHMLRMEMGDDDFFEGLLDYRDQYGSSSATTDDFQQVMAAHTAADLQLFFDQWVHRAGHPVLGIDSRVTELADGYQLDIAVEQQQEWPELWDIQLPILLDGETSTELLHVDAERQLFSLCREERPGDYEIDPERRVLWRARAADIDDYEFVDVCSGGADDDDVADDDVADDDDTADEADDDTVAPDVSGGCRCAATSPRPAPRSALLLPLLWLARRRLAR